MAPFLFNFFTTCILYAIDSLGISSKILIYADNWILINNDKKIIENEYKIIKETLKERFCFDIIDGYKLLEFDSIKTGEMKPSVEGLETKILGITFKNQNKILQTDISKNTFTIRSRTMDPHNSILYIKKFYNPKYRYYADFYKIWDDQDYKLYRRWYEKELRNNLKHMIVCLKVPNALIENIIDGNDNKLTNYLWYYAADFHGLDNDNIYIKNWLNRWLDLANFIKQNQYYIGIHTMINFILDKREISVNDYVKNRTEKHNNKRTFLNMDMIYNCIVTNKDLKSYLQFTQETINITRSDIDIYNPLTHLIKFK